MEGSAVEAKNRLEKKVKGSGKRRGFDYYCDMHSGRECVAFTLEALSYCVRLACVDWNEI